MVFNWFSISRKSAGKEIRVSFFSKACWIAFTSKRIYWVIFRMVKTTDNIMERINISNKIVVLFCTKKVYPVITSTGQ